MSNKDKDNEKKAASKVVAVAAAAGMLVSSAFSSPADLLQDDDDAALAPPAAVVEYVTADTGPDDDGDASQPDEETEEKLSLRGRIRRRILRIPQAVRAIIGVPLWGIGWGITSLLSLIWSGAVSPVLGVILKWVLAALLLLLVVALTLKAVFPDIPLKKLINKRNFLTVFIGMAALCAADAVVCRVAPDKSLVSLLIKLVGSLGVLASAVVPAIIGEKKRQKEEDAEAPEEEIAEDRDYRSEILELADSVKR